jgi:hypothetical protein
MVVMEKATTGAEAARKLLRYYQRGVYTRLEALTLLVQAAAEHPPSELAQGLPVEWLQAIREDTISPPGSPSDVLYISGILGDPNFDYNTHLTEMRQTWYDGAWNWRRYFA